MTTMARPAFVLGLLVATSACSFKHYEYKDDTSTYWDGGGQQTNQPDPAQACSDDSGACEPACEAEPIPNSNGLPRPFVHFSFDADGAAPISDDTSAYALTLHSDASGAYNPIDNQVRINGHGNSIHLDGHHYYATDGVALVPIQTGGTVSALISISHETLPIPGSGPVTIWPIISTLSTNDGASCGGYQLDIRRDTTQGLAVAFSYAYHPTEQPSECRTATHSLALNKPSWSWNTGHWHHLAATYTPQGTQARIALYWDSDSPNARLHSEALFDGQMPESPGTLYIGANPDAAREQASSKFQGNIDEVAVFAKPLEAVQLAQFTADATTYPGPSGCRWQVTEARQDGIDAGPSTAEWQTHDTAQLAVQVHDEDWGAGAVAARIAPPGTGRNMTPYSAILLTADGLDTVHTPNGAFEFALSAGDSSCTWYIAAGGVESIPRNTYRIDLTSPDYCQSASCQFNIENVEWVSIRSSWEYFPSYETRITNKLDYTIHRLDFVKATIPIDPARYGGEVGVNNWCWRTQAFQAAFDAAAKFQDAPGLNVDTVDAILQGQKYSSSAVVADFGDNTLDISKCDKIVLDAALSPDERTVATGEYPAVNIQDSSGSWQQWNWTGNTISISGTPVASSAGNWPEREPAFWPWRFYANFPSVFDRHNVTSLAIQKNWMWPSDGDKSATKAWLRITGVEFRDENNLPHCEIVNHSR